MPKDGGRDQSSRHEAGGTATNHIVVGSFGDPRPMMMGIAPTIKSSPLSQRRNPDSKLSKRALGATHEPTASNGALNKESIDRNHFVGGTQAGGMTRKLRNIEGASQS